MINQRTEYVYVFIRAMNGERIRFRLRPNESLENMMAAFADLMKKPVDQLWLHHKGKLINSKGTALSYGMCNGDTIEEFDVIVKIGKSKCDEAVTK